MRFLLLLRFLLSGSGIFLICSVSGQGWEFELRGGANLPLIHSLESGGTTTVPGGSGYSTLILQYRAREEYSVKPGARISLEGHRTFGKHFFAGAGLGMQLLGFQRKVTTTYPGSGSYSLPVVTGFPMGTYFLRDSVYDSILVLFPAGEILPAVPADNGKTRMLQALVPLFAGYSFAGDRATLRLGLQTSLLAWSEQYKLVYVPAEHQYTCTPDHSGQGLIRLSFSLSTEFGYRFSTRCHVYARYSQSLSPIYESEFQYAGAARIRLLEAGLGYKIGRQE